MESETPIENKPNIEVDGLINDINSSKMGEGTPPPLEGEAKPVDTETPKKKPRKQRKKKVEVLPDEVSDEEAVCLLNMPFTILGKPLSEEESQTIAPIFTRWLNKRVDYLAKYSVDLALAALILEALLKRYPLKTKPVVVKPVTPDNTETPPSSGFQNYVDQTK